MAQAPRILLTGPPGCGKTTAILRTLEEWERPASGFYTEELRAGGSGGSGGSRGRRVGFDVVTLDGRRGPLARAGAPGPRVGRYGVDLASFESLAVEALEKGLANPEALLVIDEIGKMELLSAAFVQVLERAFRSPNPILGTVLSGSHPVADGIRGLPRVQIVRVTWENRERLPHELADAFRG